jgi:hypothetical protein
MLLWARLDGLQNGVESRVEEAREGLLLVGGEKRHKSLFCYPGWRCVVRSRI